MNKDKQKDNEEITYFSNYIFMLSVHVSAI